MYTEMEVPSCAVTKEKLVSDLKVLIADTEALLQAMAKEAGEKFAGLRAKAEENLAAAKARLAQAEEAAVHQAKAAAKATDVYVRDNPWRAVGIAAGVSFVLGLLVGRR